MAHSVTENLVSDKTVTTIIFLNFITILALGFPSLPEDMRPYLYGLDYACLVYFVLEASIKIRISGWSDYWAQALNRFDFVIILLAAPSLVTPFLDAEFGHIIIILRAGRFLRILRALRFIPNAERLWSGVGRALRASVGLVLALSLYSVILGLLSCQLFRGIAPDMFGDPIASTYTIFQVFTIEGWHEVPRKLISQLSTGSTQGTFIRGFFVFVVVTGGLLGLSLTNAVLVDEMVMDNTDPVEKKIDTLAADLKDLRKQQDQIMTMLESGLNRGSDSSDS